MIPGPTPVPEKVLQALSKHPIGHRSKEFQDLVESTTKNLQWLHQTQNDVLTITGSGTAALEAGIINTLSKGDKVICGENGKFGERWVKVAKEFGLEVIKIDSEWGTPLDPEATISNSHLSTGTLQAPILVTQSTIDNALLCVRIYELIVSRSLITPVEVSE